MVGLNEEYDKVRIHMLGKEEISSLNEMISLVSIKEIIHEYLHVYTP